MPHGDLASILAAAARKMRADFDMSAPIAHSGSKGTTRELKLVKFLKLNLSRAFEVTGGGEVVDTEDRRSGQIDIIIHDPNVPPLYNSGSYQILPIEGVHVAIEVKSKLDLKELRSSISAIAAVKRLKKVAYRNKDREPSRVAGYVFAYDSVNLQRLYPKFQTELRKMPPEERPDGIWVLGKGAYSWANLFRGNLLERTDPMALLTVGDWDPETDILLLMILTLNEILAETHTPPFDIIPYAKKAPLLREVRQEGPVPYDAPDPS
jgi:hypothetical protein